MATSTKTTKAHALRPTALRLRVREYSTSQADYPMHEVVMLNGGREDATGGYAVKRDAGGVATGGRGQWWVGICWSTDAEHGPYATLASARKAVQTDQVLAPRLVAQGFAHR